MTRAKTLLFSLITLSLFSCQEEEDGQIILPSPATEKALILNEGNFRSANASLDLYEIDSRQHQGGLYSAANQDRPIGDVLQSMEKINGEYWLVVNNSSKIEILDPNSFTSLGQIKGLNSPRYCLAANPTKVYVSDLYEEKIYVIDPQLKVVTNTIDTKGWTEEMLVWRDQLFVCQRDSSQILVIDTEKDQITNRIPTPKDPHALVLDADLKIWVACTGGYDEEMPALIRLDLDSLKIDRKLEHADITLSIGDLALNEDSTQLYFLMDGLYRMGINDSQLPATAFVGENNRNFYAMDVDPRNGEIYISDAIDYQQRGVVYRYAADGSLIHQFKAGLIPGFFYFD